MFEIPKRNWEREREREREIGKDKDPGQLFLIANPTPNRSPNRTFIHWSAGVCAIGERHGKIAVFRIALRLNTS